VSVRDVSVVSSVFGLSVIYFSVHGLDSVAEAGSHSLVANLVSCLGQGITTYGE
jgi:hypothetical protein